MASEKKYSGDYIPDDHPDVIKKHEKREKGKAFGEKVASLVPFKTKKFKEELKKDKDKKLKLSTTKFLVDDKINRKAKKMTKTEGSFSKGGRAKLRGGGMSQRGLGRAFMKGGKV